MSSVDYQERIPNNVNLSDNRGLLRALESWQPAFLDWWKDMGPHGFQDKDVYLRTAVNVGAEGWANFDYIKMPDYRWGIFLADPEPDRTIGFGENLGRPVWQEVPGEHRADLRRLIVVQGDTEPASVEQQRQLGKTCPSIYDLRNLFQINVEEGRHLWAMVYLLHAYFGRDGREEAEGLLERRSGDDDKPRILGAFNEATPDWLSFFMFTYFTDRDGRFQLSALAESGFDPLARTTQFMLKEEAHHMFVGTAGLNRVVQRTCDLMKEHDSDDLSDAGGIGLAMLQRYLNFHYSVSLDLFGGETSTNVANYYTAGLKGRFGEGNRDDDHKLESTTHPVAEVKDGKIGQTEVKTLLALNEVLRDDYVADCQKGVDRWNKTIADAGIDLTLRLPHRGFHRRVGALAGHHVSPDGRLLDQSGWDDNADQWLPTDSDREYVTSLMQGVHEVGKMANWIAPPPSGIQGKPVDYEYVKL